MAELKCPFCKVPMTRVSIKVGDRNHIREEHFECPCCDAKVNATYDFSKGSPTPTTGPDKP